MLDKVEVADSDKHWLKHEGDCHSRENEWDIQDRIWKLARLAGQDCIRKSYSMTIY
jgi:hypothetical protein